VQALRPASPGANQIGSAVANLTGTFADQGASTVIDMNLNGPKMSVTELEALLPALGVVRPNGSSLGAARLA
jgi:AsmA protein